MMEAITNLHFQLQQCNQDLETYEIKIQNLQTELKNTRELYELSNTEYASIKESIEGHKEQFDSKMIHYSNTSEEVNNLIHLRNEMDSKLILLHNLCYESIQTLDQKSKYFHSSTTELMNKILTISLGKSKEIFELSKMIDGHKSKVKYSEFAELNTKETLKAIYDIKSEMSYLKAYHDGLLNEIENSPSSMKHIHEMNTIECHTTTIIEVIKAFEYDVQY